MAASPPSMNAARVEGDVAQGWWRAADGYWYPPEARPGQLWHGAVLGPHGEQPPGPGWWLASDYQWYPPAARPGELWADPIAGVPGGVPRVARPVNAIQPRRDAALVFLLSGIALIVASVALMYGVQRWVADAGDAVRLAAWSPMAVGSAITLIGAMRYFDQG